MHQLSVLLRAFAVVLVVFTAIGVGNASIAARAHAPREAPNPTPYIPSAFIPPPADTPEPSVTAPHAPCARPPAPKTSSPQQFAFVTYSC